MDYEKAFLRNQTAKGGWNRIIIHHQELASRDRFQRRKHIIIIQPYGPSSLACRSTFSLHYSLRHALAPTNLMHHPLFHLDYLCLAVDEWPAKQMVCWKRFVYRRFNFGLWFAGTRSTFLIIQIKPQDLSGKGLRRRLRRKIRSLSRFHLTFGFCSWAVVHSWRLGWIPLGFS